MSVSTARVVGQEQAHSTLNVSITFAGLAALGVPESALFAFPPEFRLGMRSRAKVILDRGASAPEHWDRCGAKTRFTSCSSSIRQINERSTNAI